MSKLRSRSGMLKQFEAVGVDLPIGVSVCAASGGALGYDNRRAAELWEREPTPGDPDERFCGSLRRFASDRRELSAADTPVARFLRNGDLGPLQDELAFEREDGSRVRVRVGVRALRDREGRLTGAVATLEDITAQSLAEDGREGIEAALRDSPEVPIVDIGLPDIGGYEVGDALRRRLGERVQLVALTRYGQRRDCALSKASGFDAHLVKPVEPPLLAQALERLTNGASVDSAATSCFEGSRHVAP